MIKRCFYFLILISLVTSTLTADKPAQPGFNIGPVTITPNDAVKMFLAAAELAEKSSRDSRSSKEKAIKNLEQQLINLGKDKDRNKIGQGEYDQASKTLQGAIDRITREIEADDKAGHQTSQNVQGIFKEGFSTFMQDMRDKEQRKTQIAVAAATQAVANKGVVDKAIEDNKAVLEKAELDNQASMDRMHFATENLTKYSLFVGGTVAITTLGYYGTRKLLADPKPMLIKRSSHHSRAEIMVNALVSIFYTQEPMVYFEDVTFPPKTDEQIKEVDAAMTTVVSNPKLTFNNTLLYGPPGTGKSKVSSIFTARAKELGMDWYWMSGSDVARLHEEDATSEIIEVLDYMDQRPNQSLLIIDECEQFLKNRDKLLAKGINVLNGFLERIGQPSNKRKIIFITNRPHELDSALLSRTKEVILVPLPGITEREKMIDLYLAKNIKSDAELKIAADVTPDVVKQTAVQLEGLSGRQIELMVIDMQNACYRPENHETLSLDIYKKAVTRALDGHKQTQNFLALGQASKVMEYDQLPQPTSAIAA